jgi:hypothetical protein
MLEIINNNDKKSTGPSMGIHPAGQAIFANFFW